MGRRRGPRLRAGGYKGKKCFGDRPTLVGTPGDDRIRATSGDDVIITLGGNDVIVGPKGGEWRDSYCTGTGDDQVFYYQGKDTTRFSGTIDFNIGLGPGDDRVTVLSRRSDFEPVLAGPGDDTIILGPKSSAAR